jgi:predicted ATPase
MPLNIFVLQVPNPGTKNELRRTLEAISSEFLGTWSLSLVEAQENSSWGIILTAPDGTEHRKTLGGAERSVRTVQKAIRELRDSSLKNSLNAPSPLLSNIHIQNLLSFDGRGCSIDLTALNIFIGPNGSGKSNFIEAIGILHDAPKDFAESIRETGGSKEWLWKGVTSNRRAASGEPIVRIEVLVAPAVGAVPIRYSMSFTPVGYQLEITDERVETASPVDDHSVPFMYFGYQDGQPVISPMSPLLRVHRALNAETINPKLSVLSQFKDPDQYPELTYLSRQFDSFRLYRDWEFGIDSTVRDVFPADLPDDFLQENPRNFGLMLNRLTSEPGTKRDLIKYLQLFYPDAVDIRPRITDGRVEVRLEEKGGFSTPAARLSDGTLRWLALLIILLNPNPGPVVCIEEPELGLHPDMIPTLALLLKSASERMQLIITTHSAELVEEFSDNPECVLICEKEDGASRITRLQKPALASWLEKYSLGELWRKGEIGGTRW